MAVSGDTTAVPGWLWPVIIVLGIVQLSFEIGVAAQMFRTPSERLTLGGRKWLWAILIFGVSWIGAIVFLAAGRKPALVEDVAPQRAAAARAADAANLLYGSKGPGQQ